MKVITMIYSVPVLVILLFALASFSMANAADDGFGPRFGASSSAAFEDPAPSNLIANSPEGRINSAFDDPNFDPSSIANIEPAAGEPDDATDADETIEKITENPAAE